MDETNQTLATQINEVVFNIDLWGSGVGDSHQLRGLNIWSIYSGVGQTGSLHGGLVGRRWWVTFQEPPETRQSQRLTNPILQKALDFAVDKMHKARMRTKQ